MRLKCKFDAINFEVYNGAWVDVSNDVLIDPSPKWNRGIMSNEIDAHVGDPGILKFSLNNSGTNSAELENYYSPGHPDCWSGWTTGLPVRLSFAYGGHRYYKYYGHIKPDGVNVTISIDGMRVAEVECADFMAQAANHELKTLTWAQNQRIGDVVIAVDANMTIPPLATSIQTGVEIFPTIFDMSYVRTTGLAEYIKAAMSEWGYIYVKGDETGGETLVVENKTCRTNKLVTDLVETGGWKSFLLDELGGYILTETGDRIIIAESVQPALFKNFMYSTLNFSYGKNLKNRVGASVYPRRVDAAATTVLFSLQKSFKIEPNETIANYRCAYRDPANLSTKVSGISMVAPVSGTDFTATVNENGTGGSMTADLTVTAVYGTESVIYTLQNTNVTTALWVQILQARGKGVYTYDPIQSSNDDAASQAIHGVIPLSLDFKYLSDARKATFLAQYVLTFESSPHQRLENVSAWVNADKIWMDGFLQLEPGEKAHFVEPKSGLDDEFLIMGYDAEIIDAEYVIWRPILDNTPRPGMNWGYQTSPSADYWTGVCWSPELSLFVSVASYSTGFPVMTSLDGITWTQIVVSFDPSPYQLQWRAVCWSPELMLFAAVASSGAGNRVMTSQDGTNWTLQTSAADKAWSGIAWSPSLTLFVAVCSGGEGYVQTSPNGVNWTLRTPPGAASNQWVSVCWSPELALFVAVGLGALSTKDIMTSTNGTSWTLQNNPAGYYYISDVCWSPKLKLFVASGGKTAYAGVMVITSPDGITWTLQYSNTDYCSLSLVAWSPELSVFVAVCYSGYSSPNNYVLTSADGKTWYRAHVLDGSWTDICWAPERMMFVVVANYGQIMTSL